MPPQKCKGVIAYGLAPHVGGLTSVYHNLARGLRALNWKVFAVGVGPIAAKAFDAKYADDFCVILAPEEADLLTQIRVFLEWVAKEQVDIVIPSSELGMLPAIPYLPKHVRYVTICHNVVRSSYIISSYYIDRLSYCVAISERQINDLNKRYKNASSKLRLIPHGIDIKKFCFSINKAQDILQLIVLGRIEDMAKGVMYLPGILRTLTNAGIPFHCQIVGSGPDLPRLQAAISRHNLGQFVYFQGQATLKEVPALLASADIFLMPSRFEGFGLSMVEAMAAGCVPIATYLQGVTDMIVDDGISGYLCPVGKVRAFADRIALLHRDRPRLKAMSAAARQRVEESFSTERMAADYDALFTQTLSEPPIAYAPPPISQACYPHELYHSWRRYIPDPLKKIARSYLYRYFRYIP